MPRCKEVKMRCPSTNPIPHLDQPSSHHRSHSLGCGAAKRHSPAAPLPPARSAATSSYAGGGSGSAFSLSRRSRFSFHAVSCSWRWPCFFSSASCSSSSRTR
eukprot:EG_transcript_67466